jgi:hypothetical protein
MSVTSASDDVMHTSHSTFGMHVSPKGEGACSSTKAVAPKTKRARSESHDTALSSVTEASPVSSRKRNENIYGDGDEKVASEVMQPVDRNMRETKPVSMAENTVRMATSRTGADDSRKDNNYSDCDDNDEDDDDDDDDDDDHGRYYNHNTDANDRADGDDTVLEVPIVDIVNSPLQSKYMRLCGTPSKVLPMIRSFLFIIA